PPPAATGLRPRRARRCACPELYACWRSRHSWSVPGARSISAVNEPGVLQRQRSVVWWGAGAAVAAVGWGAQQFAPLLLMYRAELGVSAATVQAVFAMYVVGLIPGLLFGGPVSDRYGRRPVVLAALAAS